MLQIKLWIISAVLLWVYVLWTRRRFYMLMLKVPRASGYPLIGIALEVRKRNEFLKTFERWEKAKNYFLCWLGPKPFFIAAEPQIAQDLLTSPLCVNRTIVSDVASGVVGDGLFTLTEPEWSRHRKILNPAFNNKVLTSFIPIFNEEANNLVTILKELCGSNDNDISEIFKECTYRLTTRTLMERDLSTEETNNDKYYTQLYDYIMAYVIDIILSPWLKPDIVQKIFRVYPHKQERRDILANATTELIKKRMKARETMHPSKEKPNFINVALKSFERGDFTYQNVEDESNIIIVAGFETTNNSIVYTLIILSMFPEYQEKLFEELQNFYPDKNDLDVTVGDMQQMVYLDMVINEVMRVMAPVPVVFRELSDDLTLSNGITLPKGLQIGVDLFNMQRRKDIWGPEAHSFNPDNFLPSNLEDKHPYAFAPFAKGVRNCIGWRYALLSMKVILAKLLRNYKFETDFKFEDLVFVEDVSLKLEEIPTVRISRRQH